MRRRIWETLQVWWEDDVKGPLGWLIFVFARAFAIMVAMGLLHEDAPAVPTLSFRTCLGISIAYFYLDPRDGKQSGWARWGRR